MGLKKDAVFLLMREALRKPFGEAIVTLGKQDVSMTYREVQDLGKKTGYRLTPLPDPELSEKPEMRMQGFLSDRSLFRMLGFRSICSVDVCNYEGADAIYDLNADCLPESLRNSADVVLDPGTIEHVFHVPNSLKNIFGMLRVGGRVIHIAPSSNHMDHGFYMFSPTLFFDYYQANRFQLQPIQMIRYRPQAIFSWKIAPYTPESFAPFSFGGLDHSMYAVYCIATKEQASSSDQIPSQFRYQENLWIHQSEVSSFPILKHWIKKVAFLYRFSLVCYRMYKKLKLFKKFSRLGI